ncbi:hypothetical protein COLO4_30779 [Corchorus olitorius]|uniref:Uncharacterized protein n=1 Tax=Corchorus olitorius TaxID=93759 RepID=A0A1R3H6V7_9ROSI|nr:hypothetical protein COLO4_30779 [Corchorus olitorius]
MVENPPPSSKAKTSRRRFEPQNNKGMCGKDFKGYGSLLKDHFIYCGLSSLVYGFTIANMGLTQ